MRILHVNSYFSTSPFYTNLYAEQEALGDEPRVYIPVARNYDEKGRDFGKGADLVKLFGAYDRFFFHYKYGKILRDARARYKAIDYDILHAHSLFSNGYIAYRLSREWHIPYVVAVRDTDINIFFKKMPHLRALGRRILAEAKQVIFISPAYRDTALQPYLNAEALHLVMEKSCVIPNGIDNFWLDYRAEPRPDYTGRKLNLLLVGQIIARKNIPAAAEAVRLLCQQGYDATLSVVGKPVDERLARKLQETPHVKLYEPRPMKELLPLYREADLFVLPSVRETFGLVYAEAISQGVPVLYTHGQGFDGQFSEGEVGYTIDPGDPNNIAQRAELILEDYAGFSRRCIEGSARFDWMDIAKTYRALYRSVLDKTYKLA